MVAKKEGGCRPGKLPRKNKIMADDLVRFNNPSSSKIDRLFILVKLSLLLSFSSLFIIITLILYQNWEKLPELWMLLGI